MKKEQLQSLIKQTRGRFFSIAFVKRDGQLRTACAKDKYVSFIKGGDNKLVNSDAVSMFDRNKKGWIAARASEVVSFKCGEIEA